MRRQTRPTARRRKPAAVVALLVRAAPRRRPGGWRRRRRRGRTPSRRPRAAPASVELSPRSPVMRWPGRPDPPELLDVDVDQLARARALVAVGRLGRLEAAALAEADPLQPPRDGRERHAEAPRRSPPRSCAAAAGPRSPRPGRPGSCVGRLVGAELRSSRPASPSARQRASHLRGGSLADAGGLGRRRQRPALLFDPL